MKYATTSILILTWLLINYSFNSDGRAESNDSGNTGAPWENGLVCANCHLGGPFGPVTETLTLKDPITEEEQTSYIPGKLYNVEIQVVPTINAARYGFQATALGVDTLEAGIWLNPSSTVQIDTAFVSGGPGIRTYVEQHVPGFTSTFRVDWQAPACDIGDITFYFIGNSVNNDGSTSGDVGGTGSTRVYQANLPENVVIDSPDITSGTFLAGSSITVKGQLLNGNKIILGSPDSTLFMDLTIEVGGELEAFISNCLE